ncbi:DUF3225 domain-containing protein [Natrarchaeobius halalkaliphilus]|uniref:DUF3225 domain-containing protein n=1 Tax=Natrarchaeobius halalkaliphilus TaxID=1679091 RepID=A0A3N6P6C4_9EURY|nr:nuclear transport factor 2 family protein [Natrarchaeobius halalkaliphilus]RQG91295.1 DUF3225 domain-containing protein [Natrarchaeobius halalkaliphilus]
MSTSAVDIVSDYYDALRRGDPLEPYFLEGDSTVKFGISEALFGYESVADALREQTATTTDWRLESHRLVVRDGGEFATFADDVTMAWRDTESGDDREFETRWSGALVRTDGDRHTENDVDRDVPDWSFVTMHVSTGSDEL